MVVCPVCEHPQASGIECEVCGKRFGAAPEAPVAIARIPELEATAVVASNAPAPPTAPIPDLERTRANTTPEVPVVPIPDLVRTRLNTAPEVPAAPMPGLESHAAAPVGPRTAAPTGVVTCRYCRNVQAKGLLCERCGMRLPKVARPGGEADAAAAASAKKKDDPVIVRHECGVKTPAGDRCTSCGVFVPLPT
jgi:hypothetical protein